MGKRLTKKHLCTTNGHGIVGTGVGEERVGLNGGGEKGEKAGTTVTK